MSLDLGEIRAKITAQTAEFERGIEDAAKKIAAFTVGFETLERGAEAAFEGIKEFIGESIDQFREAEAAQTRLSYAIAASGKAMDSETLGRYARELSRVTMFSQDAVVDSERMMVGFGLTEDQVLSLTPRIADLAAMTGGDLVGATSLVGHALNMGVGALHRYGITTSEATDEAFKNANANERVSMLMEILTSKANGAAVAMGETSAGAADRLKKAIDELKESVGGLVHGPLDSMEKVLANIANNLAGMIDKFNNASKAAKLFVAMAVPGGMTALINSTAANGIAAIAGEGRSGARSPPPTQAGPESPGGSLLQAAAEAAAAYKRGAKEYEGIMDRWKQDAINERARLDKLDSEEENATEELLKYQKSLADAGAAAGKLMRATGKAAEDLKKSQLMQTTGGALVGGATGQVDGASISGALLGQTGGAAPIIQSAVAGGAAGGAMGAIAGIGIELLKQSKTFGTVMGQVMKPIQLMTGFIDDLLGPLADTKILFYLLFPPMILIEPLLEALEKPLHDASEAVKKFIDSINPFADHSEEIAQAAHDAAESLAEITKAADDKARSEEDKFLSDLGKSPEQKHKEELEATARQASVDFRYNQRMADSTAMLEGTPMDNLGGYSHQQYLGQALAEKGLLDSVNAELAKLAATTNKTNNAMEGLSNVPQGFKVALDRFQSISAGSSLQGPSTYTGLPGAGETQGGAVGAGGITVNIQYTGNDIIALLKSAEAAAERATYIRTGRRRLF